MKTLLIILLIIVAIIIIGFILYKKFITPKMNEYNTMLNQNKQTVSIFIISKFKGKLTEENLPKMVIDQIPKLLRKRNFPLVKAKVGPQITTLIADEKIFNKIPEKKMVKADIAGLYIVDIK